MENQRPLILVSNDDGVIAKGISELVKFLRPLGEIVVMAPDAPRSGSASALTVTEPIHYQLVRKDVGLTVYKCSGTPVDCIKLALHTVLDHQLSYLRGAETALLRLTMRNTKKSDSYSASQLPDGSTASTITVVH